MGCGSIWWFCAPGWGSSPVRSPTQLVRQGKSKIARPTMVGNSIVKGLGEWEQGDVLSPWCRDHGYRSSNLKKEGKQLGLILLRILDHWDYFCARWDQYKQNWWHLMQNRSEVLEGFRLLLGERQLIWLGNGTQLMRAVCTVKCRKKTKSVQQAEQIRVWNKWHQSIYMIIQ